MKKGGDFAERNGMDTEDRKAENPENVAASRADQTDVSFRSG